MDFVERIRVQFLTKSQNCHKMFSYDNMAALNRIFLKMKKKLIFSGFVSLVFFKEKAIDTKCLYAFCRGYLDTFNHRVKHEKVDVH